MDFDDIKSGDINAFKHFFESFYPSLCLFVNKYLEDSNASKDVAQEAFVYIWDKRIKFTCAELAKSYLYSYVKNRSLNYLRDREQHRRHDYDRLETEIFFRDNLVEEETYQKIYAAIRNLSPQGQKVIEFTLDGLKNQEIADELNISINTVKTIKLRAFKVMREELKENVFILMAFFGQLRNFLLCFFCLSS